MTVICTSWTQIRAKSLAFHTQTQSSFSSSRGRPLKAFADGPNPAAESKTETIRSPAGRLFDNRDYIFTTIRNIRSYEWTHKEVSELMDDLLDEYQRNDPRDFELQQIVLVPMEWDKKQYGLGNIYDIYDGQQRLVTISLLIAALRDTLREHDEEETVKELSEMLNPRQPRKKEILRIQLRKREGEMLRRILTPVLTDDGNKVDLPPPKSRTTLTEADKRVVDNYELLLKSVQDLSKDEKLDLIDYTRENVYFLVCSSADNIIARNIVMGQGKGKNNEPIDDFKGLVCFRAIDEEEEQNYVFQKWDELASSDAVGRDNFAAACLLSASARLQKRVKKNEEVNTLEEWLRYELNTHYDNGKDFYNQVIDPACRMLNDFRYGTVDVGSLPGVRGNDALRRQISMKLDFLREISQTSTVKEIEIVVLHQLLQGLPACELELRLKQIEMAALCMAFVKPAMPPTTRHRMSFDLLDVFATDHWDTSMMKDIISVDHLNEVRLALDTWDFGSKAPTKKIASAILARLSAYVLCKQSQSAMPMCQQLQLEHILPNKAKGEYWERHWPDPKAREVWTHKLGNLAPLNQKANVRASNKSFSSKKNYYKSSPYPLTSGLQGYNVWDMEAVERRHSEILHLANEVWGL